MRLILPNIALCRLYLARTAAALAGICAIAVFLYGVFLLLAVAHTAARTDAQAKIENVSAHLSDMEAQYLAAEKSLTPERAAELGFTAPVRVSTVYADGPAHALSLRTGN